jgi:hypothetical protein
MTQTIPTSFIPDTQNSVPSSFIPDQVSDETNTPDTRNIAQKSLGMFLDPIINQGVRMGQAIGNLGLKGSELFMNEDQKAQMEAGIERATNTPTRVPILGTTVNPISSDTPENVAGNAISTVALGIPSVTGAGALIGMGGAMQKDAGPGTVSIDTLAGMFGGKILDYGFKAVSPYIEKAVIKFGQPFVDKIAGFIPDSAKGAFSEMNSKISNIIPETDQKILPDVVSNLVNKGSKMVSDVAESPFNMMSNKYGRDAQINKLEQTYNDISGNTKSGIKNLNKAESKTEALNNAGTTGRTPQRVLAENGIIPEQNGTKLSTIDQAQKLRNDTWPLRDANRKALKEIEPAVEKTTMTDLENRAIKEARTQQNIDSGKAPKIVKQIQEEFVGLRAEYGEEIPISKVDDIKSARWSDVKFDMTNPFKGDVNYLIGKSAQKTIEETATKAGFEDVAQLNREIGDRMDAAKYLESLNGNTVKGGRLSKYLFMGIGSSLGHTLPGKIVGALGGDVVADMMMNYSIASPIRRLILKNIEAKTPEAYMAALKWLEDNDITKALRLQLPEGNTANYPLPLPLKPNTSGVSSVPAGQITDANGNIIGYSSTGENMMQSGTRKLPINLSPSEYTDRFYQPPDKLPIIDFGNTPKTPKSSLPIIR